MLKVYTKIMSFFFSYLIYFFISLDKQEYKNKYSPLPITNLPRCRPQKIQKLNKTLVSKAGAKPSQKNSLN